MSTDEPESKTIIVGQLVSQTGVNYNLSTIFLLNSAKPVSSKQSSGLVGSV